MDLRTSWQEFRTDTLYVKTIIHKRLLEKYSEQIIPMLLIISHRKIVRAYNEGLPSVVPIHAENSSVLFVVHYSLYRHF